MSEEKRVDEWPVAQEAMWVSMHKKEIAKGTKLEMAVEKFNAGCHKRGWQTRSLMACRHKLRRLDGDRPSVLWTEEQTRFAKQEQASGKREKAVESAYNAEAKVRGWPERKARAIAQRLRRVSELDLAKMAEPKDAAGEGIVVARDWAPEEDALLQQWVLISRDQLVREQQQYQAKLKVAGVVVVHRSLQAITRRIQDMRLGRISRVKPAQLRVWGPQEDHLLQRTMTKYKVLSAAVNNLAGLLHTSPYVIRMRWKALRKRLGQDAPQVQDDTPTVDVEEQRALQVDPPDGWEGVYPRRSARIRAQTQASRQSSDRRDDADDEEKVEHVVTDDFEKAGTTEAFGNSLRLLLSAASCMPREDAAEAQEDAEETTQAPVRVEEDAQAQEDEAQVEDVEATLNDIEVVGRAENVAENEDALQAREEMDMKEDDDEAVRGQPADADQEQQVTTREKAVATDDQTQKETRLEGHVMSHDISDASTMDMEAKAEVDIVTKNVSEVATVDQAIGDVGSCERPIELDDEPLEPPRMSSEQSQQPEEQCAVKAAEVVEAIEIDDTTTDAEEREHMKQRMKSFRLRWFDDDTGKMRPLEPQFTSDAVQGREADITIASMVRSKTLGFLSGSDDRLLVSLSRAKDYLFVLAEQQVMCQDPMWRRLHEAAQQRTSHVLLHTVKRDAPASFAFLRDRYRCRRLAALDD